MPLVDSKMNSFTLQETQSTNASALSTARNVARFASSSRRALGWCKNKQQQHTWPFRHKRFSQLSQLFNLLATVKVSCPACCQTPADDVALGLQQTRTSERHVKQHVPTTHVLRAIQANTLLHRMLIHPSRRCIREASICWRDQHPLSTHHHTSTSPQDVQNVPQLCFQTCVILVLDSVNEDGPFGLPVA